MIPKKYMVYTLILSIRNKSYLKKRKFNTRSEEKYVAAWGKIETFFDDVNLFKK